MALALIAALATNNCIGQNGRLPWHIPADLKRFKELTRGKIVLMGRKTWESIPEKFRPLPYRVNVVISRQPHLALPPGVKLYHTIDEALATHAGEDIVIIGGGEVYRQTMALADTLYITEVNQTVEGDAFFPPIDKTAWHETEREKNEGFSFVTYKRIISNGFVAQINLLS